ncbi:MAG: aspartate carbamoyltransferase catalytic subunit [bacterium]
MIEPAEELSGKDLLDIKSLSPGEIRLILDTSPPFKQLFTRSVKKVPPLQGKTVLLLFYEPSTRTRTSFDIAAKRLSADASSFPVSKSSVKKGESLLDTISTLESMRADYIVIRYPEGGGPHLVARNTSASVVNAGDGTHSHPTQALLDAYTLDETFDSLQGRKVVIAGDIVHSRVARSTSRCLNKLGMDVGFFGPGTLLPSKVPDYIETFYSFEEVFEWSPDVLYLLRLQLERQKANFFPTKREYHNIFGVTQERFRRLRDNGTYIMHPGPVNRGVELIDEVMEYERSLIDQQVENGIAVRMSVLYLLSPVSQEETFEVEEVV